MPHFRLRKADAADDRESLECDRATVEGALRHFGQRLGAELSLKGDAFAYVLQQRGYDDAGAGFEGATPVYVVNARQRGTPG